MKKIPLIITLIVSLTGCVAMQKVPLDAKNAAAFKSQSVAQTARKKPDFIAQTPGKAALGIFGAFSMVSEGNSIVEKNNLTDPANLIASDVAQILEKELGATVVATPINVEGDEPAQIANAINGKAKFAVDVRTFFWGFGYGSSNWGSYKVMHTASTRIINLDTKEVVAAGFCKFWPEVDANSPSYDTLLAADAAVIKKELAVAAGECVKTLRKEMFVL